MFIVQETMHNLLDLSFLVFTILPFGTQQCSAVRHCWVPEADLVAHRLVAEIAVWVASDFEYRHLRWQHFLAI